MTVYETTSHHAIRAWATSQGLWPACLKGDRSRIRLGGSSATGIGETLEALDWPAWLAEFERRQLLLIYDPARPWFTLSGRNPTGG